MEASPDIKREVAKSLVAARPGKEKSHLVASLARHYDVSSQTIYRWAAEYGNGSGKKTRADKGKSKLSDKDAKLVGAFLLACRRRSNHITAHTPVIKRMLDDSGLLPQVSIATINRRLRHLRSTKKDLTAPTPHVDLISKHPNHWWSFDTTNCLQYYLDKRGLCERDLEMEFYKNKVKNFKKIKRELLRYVVVDHCSGAFFFWYYYSSGEQVVDVADFFYRAMSHKNDERYPFHGVPFNLYVDKSSVIHSGTVKNLLEKTLRINVQHHLPGNPRAKQVESYQNIIQANFESLLNIQTPKTLDELNAWALDFQIGFNALEKTRETGYSRSPLWSFITPEQLRLCPPEEVFRKLLRTPAIERKVHGNLMIYFDGEEYRFPDPNLKNRWVEVSYNPYEYPAVEATDKENGMVYLLEPIEKDIFGRRLDGVKLGSYRALKETKTQKVKKEMEQTLEQFGIKFKGTGDKRRSVPPAPGEKGAVPLQVFGHQAAKVGNLSFIDRPGMPIEIKTPVAEIPIMRAMRIAAQRAGIAITPQQNQLIRQTWGNSVSEDQIEAIVTWLKGRQVTKSGSPKSVILG